MIAANNTRVYALTIAFGFEMSDTLLPYSRFRTLVVLRTFSYEDFTIVAFCRCDGSRSCKIACFLWIAALRSNRQIELHSGVVFSNAVTIDFGQ